MVLLIQAEGVPVSLAAPPPVAANFDLCGDSGGLTCAQIDSDLADLSVTMADIASDLGVPFVDLYDGFANDSRFSEMPGTANSLFPKMEVQKCKA